MTGTEPLAMPSSDRVGTNEDLATGAAFLGDEAPPQPLGADTPDTPDAATTEERMYAHRPSHGSINAMVKDLLADPDLSYEAIVDRVKATHQGARTTARSIASTASVMRRKGIAVPLRRSSLA